MKPQITIRFGASNNDLTIKEGEKTTVLDLSDKDTADQVRRMTVEAWKKIHGKPKRKGRGVRSPRRATGRN